MLMVPVVVPLVAVVSAEQVKIFQSKPVMALALMLAVHILGRVSHLNKDLPLGMAATNATTQQR